jgi:hypothetical protein
LGDRPRRPFGVTILIVLQILSILAIVVFDLAFFNLIRLDPTALAPLQGQDRISTMLSQAVMGLDLAVIKPIATVSFMSLISLGVIVFRLVLIFGLLWLHRWAWVLVMVQVGVLMIFDLWSYFGGEPAYFSMITNVVMVFYLNQGEVQLAFRRRGDRVEAVEL